MKNLFLLLVFFLLLSNTAKGQIADKKLSAKLAALKKSGVDIIVTYYPYCVGNIMMIEDTTKCQSYTKKYLLWADKGINYIQFFDDCYNYAPITGKSGDALAFIIQHLPAMVNEKIKGVEYETIINGKPEKIVTTIDHTCHVTLAFNIGATRFSKDIDDFEADTKFVNDFDNAKAKHLNLNYAYNQHTYLVKLRDLIGKVVATLHPIKIE